MEPSAAVKDYSAPHVLLPFLAEFVENKSSYNSVVAAMLRDGCLRFALKDQRGPLVLLWSEFSRRSPVEASFTGGVVSLDSVADRARGRKAARHVAGRLSRLLSGDPPDILLWRNRNPQRILWGTRMFNNLCPGLLARGRTRYFDYTLSKLDQYEGSINVEFQSRRATVVMRLTLDPAGKEKPLISWGPISLVVVKDERSPGQRRKAEHRVEEYLGYLLSRNLPPRFSLQFEFDDPPAGYHPPDANVDFLRVKRLDDSSFFEMLFATSDDIGIVTSCDRECFNLFSLISASKENWTTIAPWRMTPAPGYLEHCYNVGAASSSMVMGDDQIEKCLRAVNDSDRPPELMIFFDSCLHRLIGEDIQGHLREYRRSSSVPVVYYDIRTTQHPYLQQMKDFWKNLYLQVSRPQRPAAAARVSFLGLGPDPGGQIEKILAALGIETGARIFPHLSLSQMREIGASSLIIANQWEYVRVIFDDMLKELDRPMLRLPLPYGIKGTTKWFEAIVAATGVQHAVEDLPDVQAASEQFRKEIEPIRGRRIGIFARARGLANNLSPALRFGVPLIPFLHELGLGVDLNAFVDPEDAEPEPGEIMKPLGLDANLGDSLACFRHASELPGMLRDGDFVLVYTEKFRDERITTAGKTPLSLNRLLTGYSGAVRTARMIAGLLKSTFFRRYHGYLEPASGKSHA
jgi:hypothetical protein